MKRVIIFIIALTISASAAFAQQYKQAVGIKLGYDLTVTYKNYLSSTNFIETGINIHPWNGFGITAFAFYDWYWDIDAAPGLSWYVGPGAQLGLWGGGFFVGIHGQIGLEYKFDNIPLALSIDYAPGLGIYAGNGGVAVRYAGTYGGLGIKYTF